MNIRATWGRRGWSGLPHGSYVRRGTDDHKANMAQGGHGTTQRTFVGQVEPMNIRVLGSSVPYGRRA
jgi:hypothetical protein